VVINMPNRNGTGPTGTGPATGWGMGPCGLGLRRGRGRGSGCSFFGRGFNLIGKWTKEDEKSALIEEEKMLSGDLSQIREKIKGLNEK